MKTTFKSVLIEGLQLKLPKVVILDTYDGFDLGEFKNFLKNEFDIDLKSDEVTTVSNRIIDADDEERYEFKPDDVYLLWTGSRPSTAELEKLVQDALDQAFV